MKKIKIVYFGSPDFSAFLLEKILLDKNLPVEVKLVVTQSDAPVGRKQILTPTPVKKIAQKHSLELLEIKVPVEMTGTSLLSVLKPELLQERY